MLLVAAFLPNSLKRFTRHPMLSGVTVWAAAHLLANGDLASLILFGSFGAFALFAHVVCQPARRRAVIKGRPLLA